ncbi:hypothetical protein GH714_006214 [Hevea brasiliensis]|uniref:NB-ARC domain-containing protein n=1 Tax=Hevea brasiliensis TaxID=3981 RepID=A0A6A6N7C5_HEVBR|nr:hypothetical protein GH714_006214 [Hevea brasiliensis]
MVSFDEDVDAVITQLLKDDPRCITISIVGIGGIGKTSLAKLIYDSKAIAEHFPCRTWVSGKASRLQDTCRRLIGLWVADGLGRQQRDEKIPQLVADECLRELVNHNIVRVTEKKLNGKLKTCRLTEAVRVHWFAKAKEANFLPGQTNITGVIRPLADRVDPNDAIFDHIHACSSSKEAVLQWIFKHFGAYSLMRIVFPGIFTWSLYQAMWNSPAYMTGKLRNQHLVSEFPQNLIELTLSASGLVEDPMQILDKLPKLHILILMSRSFVGKKMLCSYGGFPKLEVPKFKKVDPLKEWNVEKGALPSLKSLEIDGCRNLMMLPDGLRHVRTLRELKVTKLPMLSSRIKDNQGVDWNKIAHGCYVLIED